MEQKTLGRRIREERLKLNLTQEKLAEDMIKGYPLQIG